MPPDQSPRRRITVALRGGSADLGLLGSAARLAQDIYAELSGVFLEDIELLRLAELPLAMEICTSTGARRPVDVGELSRRLASQAAAAEKALARAAEGAGIVWSFRVSRGVVAALLKQATAEADITLVAAAGSAPWRLGGPAFALAGSRRGERAPVTVVFDPSEPARRTLEVGLRLASVEQRPLTVILVSDAAPAGDRLREEAEAILRGRPARFRMLSPLRADDLARAVREQAAAMLALPAVGAPPLDEFLRAHLEALGCAALLVR